METKALSSEFLRKRGSCCKSNCLHCPYGKTLNEFGVIITERTAENTDILDELISELASSDQLTNSLLAGAFGKQETYSDKDGHILSLKGFVCGIAYISNGKLIKHFLKEEFSDQGITDSYLEGLL